LWNSSIHRARNSREAVDRLEIVLTKFYLAGGPERQAIWDRVRALLERFTDTPVDQCQALAAVLQGS
jgi:hypothetical protein